MNIKRVFLIVLDSYGIGEAPDAYLYGDVGSNTLGSIAKSSFYHTPNLNKIGLFNIEGVTVGLREKVTIGSYGRMQEASNGKDTTIGHWEISGIISQSPLPTYPDGFPKEIVDEFEKQTGREIICNKPYSGTEVLIDYAKEHMETGKLIVYTSADSVFQIAAHEDIVPLEELYRYCKIAREILVGKHSLGRVIARPFIGSEPEYKRTPHRHDFSLLPPATTMLDCLMESGYETIGIGKISDIFAGKSISKTTSIVNNTDGMNQTIQTMEEDFKGLCFVNLVDFDSLYGHRNDIDGYAKAATAFDIQLGEFMNKMNEDDLLLITADHGCDPGFPGSDHSREYTPMLAYGAMVKADHSIGTRATFADIAATILDAFQVTGAISGESFLPNILK